MVQQQGDAADRNNPVKGVVIAVRPIARSLDRFWWAVTTIVVIKETLLIYAGYRLVDSYDLIGRITLWEFGCYWALAAVPFILSILVSLGVRLLFGLGHWPLPGHHNTATLLFLCALCRTRLMDSGQIERLVVDFVPRVAHTIYRPRLETDEGKGELRRGVQYLTKLTIAFG